MTPSEIKKAWNEMCAAMPEPQLAKVRIMDKCREAAIGYASNHIDDWAEFIEIVGKSGPWLRSQHWANFDWFIHIDNLAKVYEGFYVDKVQPEDPTTRKSCVPE